MVRGRRWLYLGDPRYDEPCKFGYRARTRDTGEGRRERRPREMTPERNRVGAGAGAKEGREGALDLQGVVFSQVFCSHKKNE